jgi:hypothetical protein
MKEAFADPAVREVDSTQSDRIAVIINQVGLAVSSHALS